MYNKCLYLNDEIIELFNFKCKIVCTGMTFILCNIDLGGSKIFCINCLPSLFNCLINK